MVFNDTCSGVFNRRGYFRSRISELNSFHISPGHSSDIQIATNMSKIMASHKVRTKEITTTKKVWKNTVLFIRKYGELLLCIFPTVIDSFNNYHIPYTSTLVKKCSVVRPFFNSLLGVDILQNFKGDWKIHFVACS